MYLLNKEELSDGDDQTEYEKTLFHVTSPESAERIAQYNLDWRMTTRSRFGKGACFSTCPKYAHNYSSSDGGM